MGQEGGDRGVALSWQGDQHADAVAMIRQLDDLVLQPLGGASMAWGRKAIRSKVKGQMSKVKGQIQTHTPWVRPISFHSTLLNSTPALLQKSVDQRSERGGP